MVGVNFNQLRCFELVAREQSVTKAAEQLFISQPAVSKMIRQLEADLGLTLFSRAGHTISLNREGRLFYGYVVDILGEYDRALNALHGGSRPDALPIEITLEVASALLPRITLSIKSKFPQVRLVVKQHSIVQSDYQQSDFIISSRRFADLDSVPLFTEEIFVGWKQGSQDDVHAVSLADLRGKVFAGLSPSNLLRKTMTTYLEGHSTTLDCAYEADDPATVRSLIEAGVGCGFIPAITWQELGAKLHIARILPDPPQRTIYLSTPHRQESETQTEIRAELTRQFLAYAKTALRPSSQTGGKPAATA